MNSSKPIRVTSFDHYIEVEMSGFLEVGSEAYFSELQSLVGLNTGPIGLLYSMSEVQGYAREVAIAHAQRFRELLLLSLALLWSPPQALFVSASLLWLCFRVPR